MKKFILAAVLSTLSLAAAAQAAGNSDTVTINASLQKNGAATRRAMSTDEFRKYSGSYELANGKSLALFSRGLKKYAMLHGDKWHEIVATSSNSFASLDKQLEMKIDLQENGEVRGELLIRGAEPAVAGTDSIEHVGIVASR